MLDSHALARYMEEAGKEYQPWLLLQLRLKKLQENRASLSPEDYAREIEALHHDLMNLGEWWVGRERDVFGDGNLTQG